ncbi:MAG: SUF system Fe-S cluster assembly regulator [Hydrogenophilaceae bacterium]
MLKIAKLTDYATGLMVQLSQSPQRRVSAQQLATELGLPKATVAGLLKKLGRAGLVASTRGAGGGYSLTREPRAIALTDVITAIEGPLALTECALADGRCSLEKDCATRPHWRSINQAVQATLALMNLADMTRPPARLRRMDNG